MAMDRVANPEPEHVQRWAGQRCHVHPSPGRGRGHFTTNAQIYEDYASWCRVRNIVPWGPSGLGRALRSTLTEQGAIKSQTRAGRGYYGVRLGNKAGAERADFRAWRKRQRDQEEKLLEDIRARDVPAGAVSGSLF